MGTKKDYPLSRVVFLNDTPSNNLAVLLKSEGSNICSKPGDLRSHLLSLG